MDFSASSVRHAGAYLETIAGLLNGRRLAEADDATLFSASSLAVAAAPLSATRRRAALDPNPKRVFVVPDEPDAAVESAADLARTLRAAGHALLTGTARGIPTGLRASELRDVAAWVRGLARRFEGWDGRGVGFEPAEGTSSDPEPEMALDQEPTELERVSEQELEPRIKCTPVPDRDSLGANLELRALSIAASALAEYAEEEEKVEKKKETFFPQPHPGVRAAWSATLSALRSLISRGFESAARVQTHATPAVASRAVSTDTASALQLSVHFARDPASRTRGGRPHDLVAALVSVLETARGFERVAARALTLVATGSVSREGSRLETTASAVESVRAAQDWRLRLEALACATPARLMRRGEDGSPADAAAAQALATTYHLTRGAFAEAAEAVARADVGNARVRDVEVVDDECTDGSIGSTVSTGSTVSKSGRRRVSVSPAEAWEAWRRASARADTALGAPPGDPPKPLLWEHGGRPATARFESFRVAEDRTRALCAALKPGTGTFGKGFVSAVSFSEETRLFPDASLGISAGLEAASRAAAASVGTAAGAALRSAALEGLCFFAWTHQTSWTHQKKTRAEDVRGGVGVFFDEEDAAEIGRAHV
jgi:hypothetical protein